MVEARVLSELDQDKLLISISSLNDKLLNKLLISISSLNDKLDTNSNFNK